MLIKATKSNLKKHAVALLGNEASDEKKKELIEAALNGFERHHGFHVSHDEYTHLEKLDRLLGNHGVEGDLELGVTYSNAGDTYAITLLYWKRELYIGDWGSIAERNL